MSGKRQQIQYVLALEPLEGGETPLGSSEGTEPSVVKPAPESPAVTEQLMEEVCNRENLVRAWKRSTEPGQRWRGWDDHRRRQGLPA